MDCPRCGSPMETVFESETECQIEPSRKIQKRRCFCCNYTIA